MSSHSESNYDPSSMLFDLGKKKGWKQSMGCSNQHNQLRMIGNSKQKSIRDWLAAVQNAAGRKRGMLLKL